MRNELVQKEVAPLLEELRAIDPARAAVVGDADGQRLTRSIELARTGASRTGRWHEAAGEGLTGAPQLWYGLHRARELLYERIEQRTRQMLDQGWAEELRELLRRGYPPDCPGLTTLGYPDVLALIEGRCTRAEAAALIAAATRAYAKRQITWLRADRRLRWLDLDVLGVAGAAGRIAAQLRAETGG